MNILIKDFSKRYDKQLVEIKELDLMGKVVIIKGVNGSGKSTILKAISNVIKYQGTINCEESVSYMSEVISLPKGIILKDFLKIFIRNEQERMESVKLIHNFKLENKLQSDLSDLSKGMTMKVNLIISLMIDKELYVLDEPLSGLDKEGIIELKKHIKNSKKSFLISSHITHEFSSLADLEVVL